MWYFWFQNTSIFSGCWELWVYLFFSCFPDVFHFISNLHFLSFFLVVFLFLNLYSIPLLLLYIETVKNYIEDLNLIKVTVIQMCSQISVNVPAVFILDFMPALFYKLRDSPPMEHSPWNMKFTELELLGKSVHSSLLVPVKHCELNLTYNLCKFY